MSHHSQPQPLVRSDTVPFIELPWSNKRSLNGTTPVPPRNEPLFYIPRSNECPKLLKLLYLLDPMPVPDQTFVAPESGALVGGHQTSVSTTSDINGMELCLLYICSDELVFIDSTLSENTPGQSLLRGQAEYAQSTDVAQQVRSDMSFTNI